MRIAMWSGPRNVSTALMRAWENRDDCFVCDEPLYAHYLLQTGLEHPGREETIASQPHDWQSVAGWLTGPIPEGRTIWYQKQMAHHLLPEVDRQWTRSLTNCFLIRDPREMLTSLIEFIPSPAVEDTGLPQQVELFDQVRSETGSTPPVIDGRDVLENPDGILMKLCSVVGVDFNRKMLNWPPGIRDTDGAWAAYWYNKVKVTTEFGSYRAKDDEVPDHLREVYNACCELYEQLVPHRLRVA